MRHITFAIVLLLPRTELVAGELHDAVAAGDRAAVEKLLANGANVNETTYNRFRPLHLADDPAIVEALLRYKPELGAISTYGTPLQHATDEVARGMSQTEQWQRIVALLLEAGAEYDIISAIHLNDMARVRAILEGDAKAAVGSPDSESPLRVAARDGHDEICRLLLEHNVDPEDTEGGGFPILVEAVEHPKVVELLVNAGTDVKQRITFQGGSTGIRIIGEDATALHYAAGQGSHGTVKFLIDRGVDVFATAHDLIDENKKQTALEVAAIFGKAKNAEAIVDHPEFLRADAKIRQIALDRALVVGTSSRWIENEDRPALVEARREKGANPNARDEQASAVVVQVSASFVL